MGAEVEGGFIRLKQPIAVCYKFLSKDLQLGKAAEDIFQGTTDQLSSEALILLGPIPESAWIAGLVKREIVLGLNLILPKQERPLKCLSHLSWLETAGEDEYAMGLVFQEVAPTTRDAITRLLIQVQLPETR